MISHQPKLLNPKESKSVSKGPVFEFGPGWGAKTKKWFKKYILGGKCALCKSTRYILIFGALVLIFGRHQLEQLIGTRNKEVLTGQTISEFVQADDSRIKLARRALADYLDHLPDPTLSNGQKVYIETILGQSLNVTAVKAGGNIELSFEDIKSTIEKSKSLTTSQLQRWEAAAKNVRF